jgi:hypothetical protein
LGTSKALTWISACWLTEQLKCSVIFGQVTDEGWGWGTLQ